jgi:TRAP-type C4-dicarboxylate transport system permease small subunit
VLNRLLSAAARGLETVNAPIARWGLSISAFLLALMLAVALAQIVSRGLFNHTLDWAEEVARMALVWSALLAAPMGYRATGHVAITAFIEGLPRRVLLIVGVVVNLLVAWICLMFLRESFDFVARGATIVATALPLRMSWIYSVVPLALTALWLISMEVCARLLLELRGVREVGVLVGVVPVLHQDPES